MGSAALMLFLKGVNWPRVIGYILIPLVILIVFVSVYLSGERHGKNLVQVKWDQAKNAYDAEILYLKGEIAQKEVVHRQETASISEQLRKTEAQHEATVSALNAEHAQRMQLSSARAAVYQRLAQAGPDQCSGLASHAAELDRSLEEGRGLVGELQAALGQREDQLRLLGAQIQSDHKLVDGQ